MVDLQNVYAASIMLDKNWQIMVNMGVGESDQDSKGIEGAVADLRTIIGQQPMVTHALRPIATFKLRSGMAIGSKVTLSGDRMWEFLDRLVGIAIPRIRDFRGISPKSFECHGDFLMGVTGQLIFPETDRDKIDRTRGMDIAIVSTSNTNEGVKALLDAFHFPFKAE